MHKKDNSLSIGFPFGIALTLLTWNFFFILNNSSALQFLLQARNFIEIFHKKSLLPTFWLKRKWGNEEIKWISTRVFSAVAVKIVSQWTQANTSLEGFEFCNLIPKQFYRFISTIIVAVSYKTSICGNSQTVLPSTASIFEFRRKTKLPSLRRTQCLLFFLPSSIFSFYLKTKIPCRFPLDDHISWWKTSLTSFDCVREGKRRSKTSKKDSLGCSLRLQKTTRKLLLRQVNKSWVRRRRNENQWDVGRMCCFIPMTRHLWKTSSL